MRMLLNSFGNLYKTRWSFKLATIYLGLLLVLILLLPLLPLPYLPNELDLQHTFQEPFKNSQHLLGTDQLGRDVLANLLYGARNGLFVAIPVMLFSAILGTTIGAVAGYYGNYRLRISYLKAFIVGCTIVSGLYYLVYVPAQASMHGLPNHISFTTIGTGLITWLALWVLFYPTLKRLLPLTNSIAIPLDSLMLRLTELLASIPRIMLLISIAAFASPSVFLLSVIFICTYWTGTARLARAEMLRIVQLPYIEAAQSTGMRHRSVILKEALPNMVTPVVVSFVFGVASLLTIESTLSFLGIGFPATFASWGRLIGSIRQNLSAWWLLAFPGAFLALTVLALQTISYHLIRLYQTR